MEKPALYEMKELYLSAINLLKKIHNEKDENKINTLLTLWLTSCQTLDYCFEHFIKMSHKEQVKYLDEFQESIDKLSEPDNEISKYTSLYKKDGLPQA